MGIGIRRRGKLKSGTVTVHIPLKLEGFQILNNRGETVVTVRNFDLQEPGKIKIESGADIQKTTESRRPTQSPQNTTSELKSKWEKDWRPNQTVTLKEWWKDMVSKGFIQLDSLA